MEYPGTGKQQPLEQHIHRRPFACINPKQGGSQKDGSNSTPLPGEHGFHMRDGSLLKKKREQWEREKEEGKRQWFPFGSRSSPRNNPGNNIRPTTSTNNNNNTSPVINSSAQMSTRSTSINDDSNNNHADLPLRPQPPPVNWPSPQYMSPYPVPNYPSGQYPYPSSQHPNPCIHYTNSGDQYANSGAFHSVPMPMYSSLPPVNGNPAYFTPLNFNSNYNPPYLDPNFTQNPHFNGITEKVEIVETRYEPGQRGLNKSFDQSPCPYESTFASMSIANTGESSAFSSFDQQVDRQPGWNRRHVQFATSDGQDGHERSHSKGLTEQEINEQIAERQRIEALKEEREKCELRQVEKDHIKQRQEILEANQKAAELQIEKARKEAEALRKAKLHKHILLNQDIKQEEIQKVLGIEDPVLSDSVMKQLKAFDRNRRIEMEKLNSSAHTPLPLLIPTTPLVTPLERSNTSITIRSPLARKTESTQNTPKLNNSSQSPGQTMTPLRRNDLGRGSLRIPMNKRASPASTATIKQKSSPIAAASDSISRRSSSMERLNINKPVFVRGSPARQTTAANHSPANAKPSLLKVSAGNSAAKSIKSPEKGKNLTPPVPPPRRHKPPQPMSQNNDQEGGSRHWSQSYINAQQSHIPIPPPRSGLHQDQRGYDHTLQLLSDLPDVGESPTKSSLLRRPDFGSQMKQSIGLFEPVCTRTRQAKAMTQTQQNPLEGYVINTPTLSTTRDNRTRQERLHPPLSAGYKSRSPYEQNQQLVNEGSLSPDITNNNHNLNRKYSEVERILMNQNKLAMQSSGNETSHLKAMLITPSSSKDSMSEGNNNNNSSLKPPRASPFARKLAETGAPSKKMSAG
uniref:Uncharacterized protein n=1 Tax=Ditylenchus dipsaci TaxID=166011 RepID=A0A915EF95_9BILA